MAPGDQPVPSRHRTGARDRDRDERESLPAPRRVTAARRRLPDGRSVLFARSACRDQRSTVAPALQRRSRYRRPPARNAGRRVPDRRRDAAGFHFPDDVDVWMRLQWDLTQHSRGAHFMEAVARLQPGVTPDAAARELAAVSGRLGTANPRPTADGWRGPFRCSTTCSGTTGPRSSCCSARSRSCCSPRA